MMADQLKTDIINLIAMYEKLPQNPQIKVYLESLRKQLAEMNEKDSK